MNFIFDFDSTIVSCETLDKIIKISLGNDISKKAILDNITNNAMEGKITFKESLESRLKLCKINKNIINVVKKDIINNINDGFIELITKLKKLNNKVIIVSGGFSDIIEPVANLLNIDYVYSNKFIFDKDNNVCGVEDTLLSNPKGKVLTINYLKENGIIFGKSIMIGDGYTDYETKLYDAVDEFICYAGIVEREKVLEVSKYIAKNVIELEKICLSF